MNTPTDFQGAVGVTPQGLKDFTRRIATAFDNGEIRHPVHLSDGNEERLVALFESIREQDWVFCSWRSHHQCLLKGVPANRLEADIRYGKSIALCYPEHRIVSSAIVGGVLPIALGAALAIKRRQSDERVWCFLGDMAAETGSFHECHKYSVAWDLPVMWVVEDNKKSVCTPTAEVWNAQALNRDWMPKVMRYEVHSVYPHAGAGKRVQF